MARTIGSTSTSPAASAAEDGHARRGDDGQRRAGPRHRARHRAVGHQRAGQARGAGDVGVRRADREQDGGARGERAAAPPRPRCMRSASGTVEPGAPPSTADRGHREAQVEDGDDREGREHRARQLAARIGEVAGQVRDRLPAHEGQHQQVGRGADRQPSVRRERRPVGGARRGQRARRRRRAAARPAAPRGPAACARSPAGRGRWPPRTPTIIAAAAATATARPPPVRWAT